MQRFAPYWSLVMIYSMVLFVGIAEYLMRTSMPPDVEKSYTDPVHNFPETFSQLYPSRPENHYHRGRRAELTLPQTPTIRDVQSAQLEAAKHYQRAMGAGLRSDENIIYNYALALMGAQADPGEIAAAIEQWRRDFPNSERVDLAERYKEIQLLFIRMRRGI